MVSLAVFGSGQLSEGLGSDDKTPGCHANLQTMEAGRFLSASLEQLASVISWQDYSYQVGRLTRKT